MKLLKFGLLAGLVLNSISLFGIQSPAKAEKASFVISHPEQPIAAVFSPISSDTEVQDIILSANGAAGSGNWEYNANYEHGEVLYFLNWQPDGNTERVTAECVDNCRGDLEKFWYKVELRNGMIVLRMKAIDQRPGLVRIKITAYLEEPKAIIYL